MPKLGDFVNWSLDAIVDWRPWISNQLCTFRIGLSTRNHRGPLECVRWPESRFPIGCLDGGDDGGRVNAKPEIWALDRQRLRECIVDYLPSNGNQVSQRWIGYSHHNHESVLH